VGLLWAVTAGPEAARSARRAAILPREQARVQSRECVDAAVQRFVSFPGGLEPVAHGIAADESGADLLAGELIEEFLLIGRSGSGSNPAPGPGTR
jgi:hypothetical protein